MKISYIYCFTFTCYWSVVPCLVSLTFFLNTLPIECFVNFSCLILIYVHALEVCQIWPTWQKIALSLHEVVDLFLLTLPSVLNLSSNWRYSKAYSAPIKTFMTQRRQCPDSGFTSVSGEPRWRNYVRVCTSRKVQPKFVKFIVCNPC